METTDTALPGAEQAEASGATVAPEPMQQEAQQTESEASAETSAEDESAKKPEKTPEQRAIERAERKIARLVRQREEMRAQLQQVAGLQNRTIDVHNRDTQDDSEPLTLTRAELQQRIAEEARKLAPAVQEQQAQIEHRKSVYASLEKQWGSEKFAELANDFDDALGGVIDQRGVPKPAVEAVFEADDPAALIEYLADPANKADADALARASALQAGRIAARLEAKIAAEKAARPQPSKAPAPLEPVRGAGGVPKSSPPADIKQYVQWANKQYGRI